MALAYASFYKYMVNDLPDCEPEQMLIELVKSGRRFCRETEHWHEEIAPMLAVAYQAEYDLAHRDTAFAALSTPHRIRSVVLNGSVQDVNTYGLYKDGKLRFVSTAVPTSVDDMMLLCGTTTKTAYTDYTGISDGTLIIDAGGALYTVTGIDFTLATSMDEVAHIIQTAIRTEMESNSLVVVWHIDNFCIYMESGAIGYLTAAGSGTALEDTYLKGTSTDGTPGGYILCDLTFLPTEDHTALPTWFLTRYYEAIIAGAMVELLSMEGKPWTNHGLAAKKYQPKWDEATADAIGENFTEHKTGDLVANPQTWVI